MTVLPGKIGLYTITREIGRGGMGIVYLAHDTKLDREVAIKCLPDELADDADRLARFEREAKLLASLNHPHIATIHGLEESDGKQYLILEYVEGETLAQKLGRGAIPVAEALAIANQIAEAIEAAHEKGVIHRDLKPANIKFTSDDQVKVLDFGLAKSIQTQALTDTEIANSPTMVSPGSPTIPGVVLGTAGYLSPEQAKGRPVNTRTDIFAFGCILYEMLTGESAFTGETVADTIGATLHKAIDYDRLPSETPPLARHVLKRCLLRDPKQRWHDIGDARLELEACDEPLGEPALASGNWHGARLWRILAATFVLGAIATAGVIWLMPEPASIPSPTLPISQFAIAIPADQSLQATITHSFAFSPDGSQLVYVARGGVGPRQLYLRPIDSQVARSIVGTEGAENPFFSADSQWVGFFAAGKLKKVSTQGGAPVTICDALNIYGGASWGPDDTIIFAPVSRMGLLEVPASGGTPQVLTTLDSNKGEISHRWPHFLPGGKAVLFNVTGGPNWDQWPIVVQSLETGQRRVLVKAGTNARYSPTGHLVFLRSGTLMAVPFDLERLEVTSDAVPILEGVRMTGEGAAEFSLSNLGSLIYVSGPVGEPQRRLVWVDRKGMEEPLAAPPRNYIALRLSPDGRQIACQIRWDKHDVWVYDIAGEKLTRLTFEGNNQFPIWTPDGRRITFRATRGGYRNLWWKAADGSGPVEQLTSGDYTQTPGSWSPDGRVLIYDDGSLASRTDIWALSLEGERTTQPIVQTPFCEYNPRLSPDGRWLAYRSDESGRGEIYVRPYPGPRMKWQISTEGVELPVWARNGRELFYLSGNKVMAVDIQTQPTFSAQKPQLLFEKSPSLLGHWAYFLDVTPDGQRFLMVKLSEEELPPTQLNVVLNWFEELKRLDPSHP